MFAIVMETRTVNVIFLLGRDKNLCAKREFVTIDVCLSSHHSQCAFTDLCGISSFKPFRTDEMECNYAFIVCCRFNFFCMGSLYYATQNIPFFVDIFCNSMLCIEFQFLTSLEYCVIYL